MNYRIRMDSDIKEVFWGNVAAQMRGAWGEENLTRLRTKAGIGASAVSDIKAMKRSVGLDVVEKIAAVFSVEPWRLLLPASATQISKLAPDVLDYALQINEVVNEDPNPDRRKWAMQLMALAAATDRPKTTEEIFALAQRLSKAAQPI